MRALLINCACVPVWRVSWGVWFVLRVVAITPFSAVSPLAVSYTFAALTHAPSFASSPIARVYISGYFAMIYCLVIISYLCLKSERARGTCASPFLPLCASDGCCVCTRCSREQGPPKERFVRQYNEVPAS